MYVKADIWTSIVQEVLSQDSFEGNPHIIGDDIKLESMTHKWNLNRSQHFNLIFRYIDNIRYDLGVSGCTLRILTKLNAPVPIINLISGRSPEAGI